MHTIIKELRELAKENPITITMTVLLVGITLLAVVLIKVAERENKFKDRMLEDCETRGKEEKERCELKNQQLLNTLLEVKSNVYKQLDSISNVETKSN